MAGKITGRIVAVNDEGNLITDISAEQLCAAPKDDRVVICCDEHETTGIFSPEHDQPPMTYVAVLGKAGCLELAIVGDSAKIMLGVSVGTPVEVRW